MPLRTTESADIFQSQAQAIVNPVNCVGIMGKGLALAFKKKYPRNFQAYADACAGGRLQPGGLYVTETGLQSPQYIVNLATKAHWRDPSRISWVTQGFESLLAWASQHEVESIACPAIGCGEGGLPWDQVHAALVEIARRYPDIDVELIAPKPVNAPSRPAPGNAVAPR